MPRCGFTLIELLIVIAIIAVLSVVVFSFASKAMKKAAQTKAMGNMRQIAQMINGYAAENGGRLMPIKESRYDDNGGEYHVHWHQAIVEDTMPSVDASDFIHSREWWQDYDPITLNPLFKNDPTWEIWNPGYGMNTNIAENVVNQRGGVQSDWVQEVFGFRTPLSVIPDPARTPLIVQNINYHMGGFLEGTQLGSDKRLDKFLIEGKMNVTFLDGHSELLRFTDAEGNRLPVCEYSERELDQMPKF